jgi:two-component system nitrate/nitrite response regulator NarL
MALLLEDRPGASAPAIPVALRLADAGVALRLAALPGQVPIAQLAAVLVTDGMPQPGDPAAILVLAEGEAAKQALRAGARGVLPLAAEPAEVLAALPVLVRGLSVLTEPLLAALAGRDPGAAPPAAGLTPREREVLALLAAGASNKVIARRLGMSFHTAKAHVAAVLHKLGAGSRADAVARGARMGLVLL